MNKGDPRTPQPHAEPMKGLRLALVILILPVLWFVLRAIAEGTSAEGGEDLGQWHNYLAFARGSKSNFVDHAARIMGTAGAGLLIANWWQRRRNAIDLCTEVHSDPFLELRS